MQAAVMVAFATLVAIANVPALSAEPQGASKANMTEFVSRLQPLLRASGKAGRVYYRGVCRVNNGIDELVFPDIELREPSSGETGIEAIRNMLPKEGIVEERSGVISITLGDVSTQLLQTMISTVSFAQNEQFNDSLAIMAIERNPDVLAGQRRLGYSLPTQDISIMVVDPEPQAPHLPAQLSQLTMDQAFDEVAKTFGGIVFFGVCEERRLYLVTPAGGHYWVAPKS